MVVGEVLEVPGSDLGGRGCEHQRDAQMCYPPPLVSTILLQIVVHVGIYA